MSISSKYGTSTVLKVVEDLKQSVRIKQKYHKLRKLFSVPKVELWCQIAFKFGISAIKKYFMAVLDWIQIQNFYPPKTLNI